MNKAEQFKRIADDAKHILNLEMTKTDNEEYESILRIILRRSEKGYHTLDDCRIGKFVLDQLRSTGFVVQMIGEEISFYDEFRRDTFLVNISWEGV